MTNITVVDFAEINKDAFTSIVADVMLERVWQGRKHPGKTPRHQWHTTGYLITAEEFGEVAKAMMDETPQDVYDEAIQTIACLFAMLEGMAERGEVSIDSP